MDDAKEALQQDLETAERLSLTPIDVDVWVAAAGLQKGIRRGDAITALGCTKTLLRDDPDRLWRQLVGIVVEDIGIADLGLLAQVIAVSGQKVWRQKHGGEEFVAAHLVTRLVNSPKERSTDDLLAIADWHPAYNKERQALWQAPEAELLIVLTDPTTPLVLRAMAAWFLAGTDRLPRYRMPSRRGNPKTAFNALAGAGLLSEDIHNLAQVSTNRSRSALGVMLPLVWIASQGESRAINCTKIPASPPAGAIPGYVLDGFSHRGRQALARFVATCPQIRGFLLELAPKVAWPKIISMLVFHVEGGQLDKRMVWEGSEELSTQGPIADIAGSGVPLERVDEALALISRQLSALHEARRSISNELFAETRP